MLNCEQAIKNATGRDDYTKEDIDEFIKQADALRERIMTDTSITDKSEALEKALEKHKIDLTVAAKIEKRNAMINFMRKKEVTDWLETHYNDDLKRGIKALLVGDQKVKSGARNAVDVEQRALVASYQGGLQADLESEGVLQFTLKGALDDDVARAMAGEKVKSPEANKIAKVFQKWQEKARRDANRVGAWIGKEEGYICRQTHDAEKITKAGEEEFIKDLKANLDLPRTLAGVTNKDEFFSSVFASLSSGVHLSTSKKEVTAAFKGSGNVGRRLSEGRKLHFKDADSWLRYEKKYGQGGVLQTVLADLERSAHSTGIMRKLGTNPENMLDAIKDNLIKKAESGTRRTEIDYAFKDNRHNVAEVTGQTRIVGNKMAAKTGSIARALINLSKLGGVVMSQFSDLPVYASEVRYQGRSMLSGIGEAVNGLFSGRGTVEDRRNAASMGVMADSLIGHLSDRHGIDQGTGKVHKMQNAFFRLTGMNYWTESLKISSAIGNSNRLFQEAGHAFSDVNPALKRVMDLYGINEHEWNIIRQAVDGELLTPEKIYDLPREYFSSYLERNGLKASDYRIEMLKDELSSKLRNYVSDRQSFAVLEADAQVNATFNRSTQAGTVAGETLRTFAQYKKFMILLFQRVYARERLGKQAKTGLGFVHDSPLYGISSLMLGMTALGYVSMSAKDIAKGRKPRDPLTLDAFKASFLQGGGAGIYGDFLFGEAKSRFGNSAIDTFMGPAFGTASSLLDLYSSAVTGEDVSAKAFNLALNNTPFINLFYTRIALDYMFLYSVREAMNPGYLRRYEKRIKKENDQEFFFPPSLNRARGFEHLMDNISR